MNMNQMSSATCSIFHKLRKIAGCARAGNVGNIFPAPRLSDPGIHHGRCVTHVPWCMSGLQTSRVSYEVGGGENVPGIPGACATHNFTYLVRGPLYDVSVFIMETLRYGVAERRALNLYTFKVKHNTFLFIKFHLYSDAQFSHSLSNFAFHVHKVKATLGRLHCKNDQ